MFFSLLIYQKRSEGDRDQLASAMAEVKSLQEQLREATEHVNQFKAIR
jgi:hypothetical protein